MKSYIDGKLVELTEEQEAKLRENVVKPTATVETRISAIADLAIQQMNLEVDSNA